jgi:exosortase A
MTRHRGPIAAWLLALGVAVAVALLLRESFLGMLFQWRSSSTFSYGFLILPISLFLLWRERGRLAGIRPEPAWLPVLLMVPVGALWVLGIALEVNVVHHFAAVLLVVLAVWAVAGNPALRVIWFPLGYLLLMVPFGEFMVPTLMEWTADFAVLAVSLSGVPVFQDGFVFSLPSGDFEVIKACSGIRFLMATVAAGTVFAWVAYRSWRKRLLFLVACLVVPVLGNLLRAYLVVMIVFLSDGRLAGAHVTYGMIFFGAILFGLFVVGARYADPPAAAATPGVLPVPGSSGVVHVVPAAIATLLVAFLIAAGPGGLRERVAGAGVVPLPPLPAALAGYDGPSAGTTDWQPQFRGAAGHDAARYRPVSAATPVDIFVAAYDPSLRTGKLTDSSSQVFDPRVWRRVGGRTADGHIEDVLRPPPGASVREGTGRIVWSWYVVNGRTAETRVAAKLLELRGVFSGAPAQQAMVVISATFEDEPDRARRDLQAFGAVLCAARAYPCPPSLAGHP